MLLYCKSFLVISALHSLVDCERSIVSCDLCNSFKLLFFKISGSGELEFEEFVTLASRFMVEEDAEAMQQELKEAFRLYDKEGTVNFHGTPYSLSQCPLDEYKITNRFISRKQVDDHSKLSIALSVTLYGPKFKNV